jgi:hypothetical protein
MLRYVCTALRGRCAMPTHLPAAAKCACAKEAFQVLVKAFWLKRFFVTIFQKMR